MDKILSLKQTLVFFNNKTCSFEALFVNEDGKVIVKRTFPAKHSLRSADSVAETKAIEHMSACLTKKYGDQADKVCAEFLSSSYRIVLDIIKTGKLPMYLSYTPDKSNIKGVQLLFPLTSRNAKGERNRLRIGFPFSNGSSDNAFLVFMRAINAIVMIGRKEWKQDYVFDKKLGDIGGSGRLGKHYMTVLNNTGELNIKLETITKELLRGGTYEAQCYIVRVVINRKPHVHQFGFGSDNPKSSAHRTQQEALALAIECRDELLLKQKIEEQKLK